jgi:hypothetical protein
MIQPLLQLSNAWGRVRGVRKEVACQKQGNISSERGVGCGATSWSYMVQSGISDVEQCRPRQQEGTNTHVKEGMVQCGYCCKVEVFQ